MNNFLWIFEVLKMILLFFIWPDEIFLIFIIKSLEYLITDLRSSKYALFLK